MSTVVGLQSNSDYPYAGCANEMSTAAEAAMMVGVLIKIWLQVSHECRPSGAKT